MEKLSKLERHHLELFYQMINADGRKLFPLDIYASGSIKRSLAHCKGFATLIDSKNLTCAGAVIRLQLDTLLRFYAAFLVEDPHEFSNSVLGGKQVNDHKDHNGRKMTDAYLVGCLTEQYPWIKEVYKQTSGYVHFSTKHIFAAIHSLDEESGNVNFQISPDDVPRSKEFYQEAIDCFYKITIIFLEYVEGWIATKNQKTTASQFA